jgi:hypothetical protein
MRSRERGSVRAEVWVSPRQGWNVYSTRPFPFQRFGGAELNVKGIIPGSFRPSEQRRVSAYRVAINIARLAGETQRCYVTRNKSGFI